MTNREMLNKLPDDDLMKFLDWKSSCPPFKEDCQSEQYPKGCRQCWLDWLQEKAMGGAL